MEESINGGRIFKNPNAPYEREIDYCADSL